MRLTHSIRKLGRRAVIGAAALPLAVTTATWADARLGRLPVPAKAAVFDAGQTTPTLDGLLPPVFDLPEGAGRYFSIESISGSVTSFLNNDPFVGPGGYGGRQTDINSANGISGISCVSSFFLTGVFLGNTPPTEPAPPGLAYSPTETPMDQEAYTPVIAQTFFIGDGLVGIGTGAPHRFIIPQGATRLFLGFADAGQFQGDPGAYADNYGWLDVRFRIVASSVIGDLNGDGFVGIGDLNVILGRWNQQVIPGDFLAGDPSGDGFVGIDDLGVVLGNWNAGTPPANVSQVMPEPALSTVLAWIGLIAVQCRRRHV